MAGELVAGLAQGELPVIGMALAIGSSTSVRISRSKASKVGMRRCRHSRAKAENSVSIIFSQLAQAPARMTLRLRAASQGRDLGALGAIDAWRSTRAGPVTQGRRQSLGFVRVAPAGHRVIVGSGSRLTCRRSPAPTRPWRADAP